MTEIKTKRRLRSVILISAVSAVACGGRAEENDRDGSRETGDGDGDGPVVGDPIGDYVGQPIGEPPYDGTGGFLIGGSGGNYFVGAMPTGGTGAGGHLVGTGGAPGEPPYLGGMGGSSEEVIGDQTVGVPVR